VVEFPDFRDGVEFVRIIVPAIHEKLEATHHGCQFRSFRQRSRTEGLEEVGELALPHLFFAEHDDDRVSVGLHGVSVQAWIEALVDDVHPEGLQGGLRLGGFADAGFVARHQTREAAGGLSELKGPGSRNSVNAPSPFRRMGSRLEAFRE
jgi:hypothetical protein